MIPAIKIPEKREIEKRDPKKRPEKARKKFVSDRQSFRLRCVDLHSSRIIGKEDQELPGIKMGPDHRAQVLFFYPSAAIHSSNGDTYKTKRPQ